MVDPFSFASGVAGLVGLVDLVATKGHKYVQAVKNCDREVKQLFIELDLFSGVIRRLAKVAEDEEKRDGGNPEAALETAYVYECQAILRQIHNILGTFEKNPPPNPTKSRQPLRETYSKSREGDKRRRDSVDREEHEAAQSQHGIKDLKWPLSRGKTVELREHLERQKTACILALSASSTQTIHEILRGQELTNKELAEIKSEQRKFVEIKMAEELGESSKQIVDWFSPVDPSKYHQAARNVHQKGTGKWFLDLEEFKHWYSTPNATLWIYGIPGAGKTILSSLIIEEVFNLKSTGTAYYYCTYRDDMSQKPIYILGSLVRQLALQKPEAFDKCKEFYWKYHPDGRPPSVPSEVDLTMLLREISTHFEEVSIVLDGLDECGATARIDRSELLHALAKLNHPSGRIRLAVASRQEHDIKQCLESFDKISIAALSSDLELYVAAEVSRRLGARIRDEVLQHEIIEALINGAEGMFQWVKCQLDYLIRLPTDSERRKALKQLPPDLPATYIRIFERICRDYPPQTQEFISRIFKWLAFGISDFETYAYAHDFKVSPLTMHALAIAITIDVADGHLNEREIPSIDDILEWCGSLIRVEEEEVALSHFTVKEFLISTQDAVQSHDAVKFLVDQRETRTYLASASMIYISHPKLPKAYNFNEGAIDEFDTKHPFYEKAAILLVHYLSATKLDFEEVAWSRRFFTSKFNVYPILWVQYLNSSAGFDDVEHTYYHPLHLAALYGRYKTCQRLLSEGSDVNVRSRDGILPIDLAIADGELFLPHFDCSIPACAISHKKLDVIKLLIEAGASIDHTVNRVEFYESDMTQENVDLLTIALYAGEPDICGLLLEMNVSVNELNLIKYLDFTEDNFSPPGLIEARVTDYYDTLNMILKHVHKPELQNRFRAVLAVLGSETPIRTRSTGTKEYSIAEELFAAIDSHNELALDLILEEVDSPEFVDECGRIPLEAAIDKGNQSFVARLVRAGADIHRLDSKRRTPLEYAYREWDAAIVRERFELWNDDIDDDNTSGEDADNMDINDDNAEEEDANDEDASNEDANTEDANDVDASDEDIAEDQLGLTRSEYRNFMQDPPSLNREYIMQGIAKGLRKEHCSNLFTTEELAALRIYERDNVFQFAVDTESEHMLALLLSVSWGTSDGTLPRLGTQFFDPIYLESTLLHYAARTGKIRAVKAILRSELGAKLVEYGDYWGKTTLHSAIEGGNLVVLKSLLACGANITAIDFDGRTPLHMAVLVQTSLDVVKALIASGADINVQDHNGWAPLTLTAYLMNLPLLNELANAGADLNIRGPSYWCPLGIAIERGGQDVMEYLVKAGADIEIKDEGGRTPLMSAVRRKDLRQAKALIRAGANVNARDHARWCPLTVAIITGSRTIVSYLLSHRANVNLKGPEGCTALHMSARMHQLDIVGELLHSGASLTAVNDDGETPLQFARQGGELPATLEILLKGSGAHVDDIVGSKVPPHSRSDRSISWTEFSRSINHALDSVMNSLSVPMGQP